MRKAILLVAGDKSGVSQSKFYKRLIALPGHVYFLSFCFKRTRQTTVAVNMGLTLLGALASASTVRCWAASAPLTANGLS
jgi:hypothetical protein